MAVTKTARETLPNCLGQNLKIFKVEHIVSKEGSYEKGNACFNGDFGFGVCV